MKLKIFFTLLLIYNLLFTNVFAEILFYEIMPNTDDDTNLEYIELYNSWSLEQSLSWFILKDKSNKEFIFGSWNILLANEKKKYYRTETKILLNNSDEELYLYDNLWNQIDYFNYAESVNNEVLLIIGKNSEVTKDIEEENYENDTDNEKDNNESEDDTVEININIPDIIFSFQSPTYLIEKDSIVSTYNCDSSKDWCKVNLDFRNSFEWEFSENDFDCITTFWFISWEENKCNPSTFLVPLWNYTFEIRIKDKNNSENFKEKIFQVINRWYIPLIKSSWSSWKKNTWIPPVIIKKPKIFIESWLNKDNKCNNKNNCNVNFRYVQKSKYEKCNWEFPWWIFEAWTNTKCNPWYIKYWTWEYIVKLRVYEKGDYFNFKESKFLFWEKKIVEKINKKVIKEEKIDKKVEWNEVITPILNSFPLQEKEATGKINSVIILQWKIWKNKTINWNILTCYETCSVNFDWSLSGWKIKRYSWDFWNGERYEWKNPWYIKYETPWNYKIYLLSEWEDWWMDIWEFYVNFIDSNEEENPPILNSFPQEEKEAAVSFEENKIEEYNDIKKDDNMIVILLYILIGIFWWILIVLILRKESLL